MQAKQEDFYQRFRMKLKRWVESENGNNNKWIEYLMFGPDLFHLLCKLSVDAEVPTGKKVKLVGVITYFISPIDLVPELLFGPAGFVDDIALAAYVLNNIINDTSEEIVRRHWAGNGDVLKVIKSILRVADEMVGLGLWKKIQNLRNKKN